MKLSHAFLHFAFVLQLTVNFKMYFDRQSLLHIYLIILSNNLFVKATELVEHEGKRYITGKGCGISKPIKFLTKIPENIKDFECSIITNSQEVEKTFFGNLFLCTGSNSKIVTPLSNFRKLAISQSK